VEFNKRAFMLTCAYVINKHVRKYIQYVHAYSSCVRLNILRRYFSQLRIVAIRLHMHSVWLGDFGLVKVLILPFSIGLAGSFYNIVRTTMLYCNSCGGVCYAVHLKHFTLIVRLPAKGCYQHPFTCETLPVCYICCCNRRE